MKEKIKSAVYGFAIGDALGVPYEFKTRDTFRCVGMVGGGSHSQPVGTWSDDTSMVLATMASLIKHEGNFNADDIMDQFVLWKDHGAYTPWGNCFDIGNTTARAIRNRKGETSEWSNGNGSLMRILPFAFLPYDADIIDEASALTHDTSKCKCACEAYVELCQDIIKDKFNTLNPYYNMMRNMDRRNIRSTGYVWDSFFAALWSFLISDSYDECVLTAVNLGDDTDTIGALAGALAGLYYGFENIPSDWIDKLAAKDQLDGAIEKFSQII